MDFQINMLLPIDQDGTIIVPINQFKWISRTRSKRMVLDLGDNIVIEQWDAAIYFNTPHSHGGTREFLRYDVDKKQLQYRNLNQSVSDVNTVEELQQYYLEHFTHYNLKPEFQIWDYSKP